MTYLSWSNISRIGDEIHYDGELVAVLIETRTPARGQFEDLMVFGPDKEEDDEPARLTVDVDEDELDQIYDEAMKVAKGGLIRARDLKRIIAKLKEAEEE